MTNLLMLIDSSRRKMIELADKYGYTSKLTVECSQQLDRLLNQFMMEEQKKRSAIRADL
jgi:stage 0 sporulation regulatory protein